MWYKILGDGQREEKSVSADRIVPTNNLTYSNILSNLTRALVNTQKRQNRPKQMNDLRELKAYSGQSENLFGKRALRLFEARIRMQKTQTGQEEKISYFIPQSTQSASAENSDLEDTHYSD